MNEDAIGEGQDFFELERHEEDRASLVALLDQAVVDELGGADVEAARGLRGDQRRGSRPISRASRSFADSHGESRADGVASPTRTSNSRQRLRRALDEPSLVGGNRAVIRRGAKVVQPEVLAECQVEDQSVALAVLWDGPRLPRSRHGPPVRDVARPRERPVRRESEGGDRVDKLPLTVSVDARDADDLATLDLQGDPPDPLYARDRAGDALDRSSGSPDVGGPARR